MTAVDIAQIPFSPELSATMARAAGYAASTGADEIALEHVLAGLCDDPDAVGILQAGYVSLDALKADLGARFFSGPQHDPVPGKSLRNSDDVRRVLDATAAAARGSRRSSVNGAIVIAAIVGDAQSVAAEILQAHGLTFEAAIRALQTARPVAPAPQSNEDVLAQARSRVQSRSAPSLSEMSRDRVQGTPPPQASTAEVTAPPAQASFPDTSAEPPQPFGAEEQNQRAEAEPSSASSESESIGSAEAPSIAEEPELPLPAPESETVSEPEAEPELELPETPVLEEVFPSPSAAPVPARPEPPYAPPLEATPVPAPLAPAQMPAQIQEPTFAPAPTFEPQSATPRSEPPTRAAPAFPYQAHPAAPASAPPREPAPSRPSFGQSPFGQAPFAPGPSLNAPQPAAPTAPAPSSTDILSTLARGRPAGSRPPPIPPAGAPGPSPTLRVGPQPSQQTAPMPGAPSGIAVPADLRAEPQSQQPSKARSTASGSEKKRKKSGKIEQGQLAENVPRSMRVGRTERAEIRIAKSSVKGLTDGLDGSGPVFGHTLAVTQAMAVRLRAPEGGFFIETVSPETQWIESNLGYASDDFASWRFLITPQERGWASLQIVVSARTVGANGIAAETALPDQIIEVKVRRNLKRTIARLFGWTVAAIVGGALSTFGVTSIEIAKLYLHKIIH